MSFLRRWILTSPILVTSAGWGIGGDPAWYVGSMGECAGDWMFIPTSLDYWRARFLFLGIMGFAMAGLVTGYALRSAKPAMQWTHIGMIGVGWTIAPVVGVILGYAIAETLGHVFVKHPELFLLKGPPFVTTLAAIRSICMQVSMPLGRGLTFLTGGVILGYVLWRMDEMRGRPKTIGWIAAGWFMGLLLGPFISDLLLFPAIGRFISVTVDNPWYMVFEVGLLVLAYVARIFRPDLFWLSIVLVCVRWVLVVIASILIGIIMDAVFLLVVDGIPLVLDVGRSIDSIVLLQITAPATAKVEGVPQSLGYALGGAIGMAITLHFVHPVKSRFLHS